VGHRIASKGCGVELSIARGGGGVYRRRGKKKRKNCPIKNSLSKPQLTSFKENGEKDTANRRKKVGFQGGYWKVGVRSLGRQKLVGGDNGDIRRLGLLLAKKNMGGLVLHRKNGQGANITTRGHESAKKPLRKGPKIP